MAPDNFFQCGTETQKVWTPLLRPCQQQTLAPGLTLNIWASTILGYLPPIMSVVQLLRSPALTWPKFRASHSHLTSHRKHTFLLPASRDPILLTDGPIVTLDNCISFSFDANPAYLVEITSLNLWTSFMMCSPQGSWFHFGSVLFGKH